MITADGGDGDGDDGDGDGHSEGYGGDVPRKEVVVSQGDVVHDQSFIYDYI